MIVEKIKNWLLISRPKTTVRSHGKKRRFFAQLFSFILLGNLFASHHSGAAELTGLHKLGSYSQPQREAPPDLGKQQTEKARALWSAAAMMARPLLLEHEDCQLFQGTKKVGNFGVFWPRKVNQPRDAAFRSYVKSEKRIVNFIVDTMGPGPERDLTLYQMAQVYSFVYNTTVASGERALNALKTSGMKTAQAFMSRIDRVKGMKAPLRGLADRRKDEAKLGAGEFDIPLTRRMADGTHHTLASLQAHYDSFVSRLGGTHNDDDDEAMPHVPTASRKTPAGDEPSVDPI
jgi:hypothetical protein